MASHFLGRPELTRFLQQAENVMHQPDKPLELSPQPVKVGVDLGTAFTVVAVLDAAGQPLSGAYQFAQVVRDGLVVDFQGAVTLLSTLKDKVEQRLGFSLTSAATTYPPGVPLAEVRATRYVLEAAGFDCRGWVDEPSAANTILRVENGAVVDVGGGTTGIAIVREGQVVVTADEPTGGTHFSLVIAGALDMSFEAAEVAKRNPANHPEFFNLVRPVMEKVGTIITRHINAHSVETLVLVGGSAAFQGFAQVIEEVTGISTYVPPHPMFVTPFGVALTET